MHSVPISDASLSFSRVCAPRLTSRYFSRYGHGFVENEAQWNSHKIVMITGNSGGINSDGRICSFSLTWKSLFHWASHSRSHGGVCIRCGFGTTSSSDESPLLKKLLCFLWCCPYSVANKAEISYSYFLGNSYGCHPVSQFNQK